MKTRTLLCGTFFLVAYVAMARMIFAFPGWNRLEEMSPYIIVANCGKPTPPTPGVLYADGPASDFAINIAMVLKGTNTTSAARLWTDYGLQQGKNYLVFGYYADGIYQAYEAYRVIPLGVNFSTNVIAGKPLHEQLKVLFKQRIDHLDSEIKSDESEKQRLGQLFKTPPILR